MSVKKVKVKPTITYTYVPGPDPEEDRRAVEEVYRIIYEEANIKKEVKIENREASPDRPGSGKGLEDRSGYRL